MATPSVHPLPAVRALHPALPAHLAVDEDHGAQQPPGAALTVHVQHPQDLEEADAPAGERRRRCAPRPTHLLSPRPGAAPQSLAQNRPLKHGVGGPTQPAGLQTPLLPGEALGSPHLTDEQTEVPRRLGPSPSPGRAHAGPPTHGNLSPCGVGACAPPHPQHTARRSHSPAGTARGPLYLMAEVANTCPLEPTQRTTMEARTTIRSGEGWHVTQPGTGSGEGASLSGGHGPSDSETGPLSRAHPRPPPRPLGRQTPPHRHAECDRASPVSSG